MNEVFERELEVGLALLRGARVPTRVMRPPVRLDFGRWLVAALLCIGASVVVAVAAWPWADGTRSEAQDPQDVSDTQIRDWVAALAKPVTSAPAARRLALHGRRAVPFLARALSEATEFGHQARILSALAGCHTAAAGALQVLRAAQESLPIGLAPVASWATAQLVPYTDLPVTEFEPMFELTGYRGRSATGPTWSVRYGTAFQVRRFRSRATLRQGTSITNLLVAVEATNPQLREVAAELLSLRGAEARSTVGALARRIAPGAITSVVDPRGNGRAAYDVGSYALALSMGHTHVPFVPLPNGMTSVAAVPAAGNKFYVADSEASPEVQGDRQRTTFHLTPNPDPDTASALELIHCARALVSIAPEDPRTCRARVVLALAPLLADERVRHLEALRRWGAADLRPFAAEFVQLVTLRETTISRAAADLLSIAWSGGDLTDAESSLLQRALDYPVADHVRAVLQRIRDR